MNNKLTLELLHSALEEDALQHHGILGMKWGKRNGPPYPLSNEVSTGHRIKIQKDDYGLRNLKKAKTANLDKWGTSPNNNILFVAGYSGSGKSTTALRLAKKGKDTVIHLDAYSEPDSGGAATIRSKKFDKYLDKNVPRWREMPNAQKDGSTKMERHSKEYWDVVDNFRNAIESYARKEYKKGNRVIVEGVQMADDWLAADKNYYKDKPMVVLNTGAVKSIRRAFQRDDRGGFFKGLASLDSAKEYLQWYVDSNKRLKKLSEITGATKGKEYLNDFMAKYADEKL